jgi:hypothetical protein
MRIKVVGTAVVAFLTLAALPTAAQAQVQNTPTPKHRLAGSYYWQQNTPRDSYYWQQSKPPEQKPAPKPEPKPETKPGAKITAAMLVGKWDVNVETQQGAMQSLLVLKADPKNAARVTGTITSQMGEAPVEGEVTDGTLTFWISMEANGSTLSITFTGKTQKDGSLAGTMDFGQGEISWTATKAKN